MFLMSEPSCKIHLLYCTYICFIVHTSTSAQLDAMPVEHFFVLQASLVWPSTQASKCPQSRTTLFGGLKRPIWDLPGCPVVRTPRLTLQGPWVQSLVRELRIYMPHGVANKKRGRSPQLLGMQQQADTSAQGSMNHLRRNAQNSNFPGESMFSDPTDCPRWPD